MCAKAAKFGVHGMAEVVDSWEASRATPLETRPSGRRLPRNCSAGGSGGVGARPGCARLRGCTCACAFHTRAILSSASTEGFD